MVLAYNRLRQHTRLQFICRVMEPESLWYCSNPDISVSPPPFVYLLFHSFKSGGVQHHPASVSLNVFKKSRVLALVPETSLVASKKWPCTTAFHTTLPIRSLVPERPPQTGHFFLSSSGIALAPNWKPNFLFTNISTVVLNSTDSICPQLVHAPSLLPPPQASVCSYRCQTVLLPMEMASQNALVSLYILSDEHDAYSKH